MVSAAGFIGDTVTGNRLGLVSWISLSLPIIIALVKVNALTANNLPVMVPKKYNTLRRKINKMS